MKYFALVCWVLLLSWATNFVASPAWRTPDTTSVLLSEEDAVNSMKWSAHPAGAVMHVDSDRRISVVGENTTGTLSEKRRMLFRNITIPEQTKYLRFQALLQTDTSGIDRYGWQPRPVLILRTDSDDRNQLIEKPVFFVNTVRVDKVIALEQYSPTVELLYLIPSGQNWQLSNVSLRSVLQSPRYKPSRVVLAAMWLLTLFVGVYKAWQRARLPTVMVIGVLVGVLGGILASKDIVSSSFDLLHMWLTSVGIGLSGAQFGGLLQLGHVILFAVLSLVVLIFHKHWSLTYIQAVIGVGVLSVATEALQRYTLGRSPDVKDVVLDLIGVIVGMGIYGFFRILYKVGLRSRVNR